MEDIEYKAVGLSLEITPEMNRLLSQAAVRAKRTKVMEALLRLEDHLFNFPDIATHGKRFGACEGE
ncbi:TraY domain-containing protein [Yersinia enterocolitica]|uniref:TraY domain-containing protein n=1 Tax=Yersinia enterocolitica TaxID=630 RepID=UPI0027E5573E|nr:TraY domain-containing protein [Yersinia enterocolitica]